ncbi:MAG: acylphosphatase [Thermoplasmata archaeon]|nr:acylphosphatase [Thermoplasmata archaeon]
MNASEVQPEKVIQATIKVHGRVQQVGYRKKVKNAAEFFDITGFVENMKDPSATDEKHQPVRILCQGTRPAIEKFAELISIENGYIDVENVEVSYREEYDTGYSGFYRHKPTQEDQDRRIRDAAFGYIIIMDEAIRTGNKKYLELEEQLMKRHQVIEKGDSE